MTLAELSVLVVGEGRDLVLLHGGAGSRDDLDALRVRLGHDRRVIAPDQRAHGRSPDLGELSYPLMAGDTAAILDKLDVRGADLVGFSDGGIVALLVARDRPDLVHRVIAIGANVAWSPPAPPIYSDTYLARLQAITGDELAMPPVRTGLPEAAAEWPHVVEKYRALWLGDPGITLGDLAAISASTLYVAGDGDFRVEHTIAMFRATPTAQLSIIPGTGHDVPGQQPDQLATIAERFLT